jgi:hypothetical protein
VGLLPLLANVSDVPGRLRAVRSIRDALLYVGEVCNQVA